MLTRLAPTPSGYLHTGNAFSFLLTEHYVKQTGSKILLRIDDMDAERKRPEYVQDIFETLHWLGIEWQAGPKDTGDFEKHWSQQYRMHLYNDAIQKLISGNKVYACSCSRKQIRAKGQCDCEAKNIPVDTPDTALRMRVKENTIVKFSDNNGEHNVNLSETAGPFIVRRRDGLPAYQLFSLIDDFHFNITTIVRGQDLFHSTAAQVFLAEQLGENIRSRIKFIHHPLLTDEKGNKLSKSESALSLKSMRERGIKAIELRSRFEEWRQSNNLLPE